MPATEKIRYLEEAVAVCRAPHTRVLRVCGDDALSWLNSVTTQDLRAPAIGSTSLALFSDARGRVRADAVVLQAETHIDVLVPAEIADKLLQALESRIVMEDVELSLPDVVALTAQGPQAGALGLAARGFVHDRFGTGGFDLLVAAEQAASTEAELRRQARERGGDAIDDESWEHARVLRGLPRFGADFGPDTYPQEAGLEATHVSFEKGCYVGQEAIHMLQVRGKPPRRLMRLELSSGCTLSAGTPVTDGAGARVGQVTSWTPSEGGSVRVLAIMRRATAESDDVLEIDGQAASRVGTARAI